MRKIHIEHFLGDIKPRVAHLKASNTITRCEECQYLEGLGKHVFKKIGGNRIF